MVSCNLFIYSNNIVSAVAGRGIRQNGRDAAATVLTVVKTRAVMTPRGRTVLLRLRVVPSDGSPPYEAQLEKLVSPIAIPRPGDQVRVRYLPSDPSNVAIVGSGSFVSDPTAAAPVPAASDFTGEIASDLARLTSLLQSGVITQQQYEDIIEMWTAQQAGEAG